MDDKVKRDREGRQPPAAGRAKNQERKGKAGGQGAQTPEVGAPEQLSPAAPALEASTPEVDTPEAGVTEPPSLERPSPSRPRPAPVTAYRGFFPIVYGEEVEVSQGGGLVFIAKDELEIEQGGGQWLIGLRKLEIEQGGGAVLVTQNAEVSRGVIGLLVSGRTELKDGSRVLMTLPHALLAGLVAGVVVAAARWWSRTGEWRGGARSR